MSLPMRRLCFLVFITLLAGCARGFGQHPGRSHLLRLGLASVVRPGNASLSYEFRWNAKAGIAIQGCYYQHNRTPETVFEGDWITTYAQQRVDSNVPALQKILYTGEWQYLTENRPLPEAPGSYVSLNSLVFKIGYVMPYTSGNGRWSLMLQPGVFAGRHRYFSISDDTRAFGELTQSWSSPYLGAYYATTTERTRFYRQTRSMRIRDAALYGLSYDLAVAFKPGKRLFVELRGGPGYNLNEVFEAGLPAPARRFYGQLGINIGYTITPRCSRSAPAPR